MEDKATLLTQLRIDRGPEKQSSRSWTPWIVLLVFIAAAAGAWLVIPHGIPVTAVEVKALGTVGSASTAASILDASGYVVARRQATVASKITGRVVEVLIEEGQKVEKDAVIARLDDSNSRASLLQAEAQVAQAEANLHASKVALDDARPIYQRNQQQHKAGVISAQAFDSSSATFNAAEADYAVKMRAVEVARASLGLAQRNREDTIVRAPFTGIVTVKAAQAGEMVSPVSAGGGFTRTGIGTIVDMDSLEVEVDVSENFINRVRPGQPANIRLNAYQEWQIPAEVIAVIPTADRSRATVKVRVAFKEKDDRVLPEMGARVSFLSDPNAQVAGGAAAGAATPGSRAVVVPVDAVRVEGETGVVFVIRDQAVERRAVRLGARTPEGQTIMSGLTPGLKIAGSNLDQLSDGAKVAVEEVTKEG